MVKTLVNFMLCKYSVCEPNMAKKSSKKRTEPFFESSPSFSSKEGAKKRMDRQGDLRPKVGRARSAQPMAKHAVKEGKEHGPPSPLQAAGQGFERKGARSMAAIPPQVLAGLNQGELEAKSLAEGLAINFSQLILAAAPSLLLPFQAQGGPALGIAKRMSLVGLLAAKLLERQQIAQLEKHTSDTVRGWACFAVAELQASSLSRLLDSLHTLADDPHFGVREWAWMAARPAITANLDAALQSLQMWAQHDSPNIRRFAVEATRPRGVWAPHIPMLKKHPERAQKLLTSCRADPHKYVQDSVANWLNDAAKEKPDWVRELCAQWIKESPCAATERICNRATRSLR